MLLILPLFQFCSTNKQTLNVVDEVDLEKYTGTWYEIARLPNRFEEGLKCITATYQLRSDGKISVINRGHNIENPEITEKAEGWAKIPNKQEPGKLKVTFFWPFFGKYWILELDEDYQHVLVGSPSRKYLWILSRDKEMNRPDYDDLVNKAKGKGFDISKLIKTKHDCDPK